MSHCCRLEVSQVPPWNVAAPGAAPDLRWQQPTGSLTLASGEIHVWRVQLDQPAPQLDPFTAMLSEPVWRLA